MNEKDNKKIQLYRNILKEKLNVFFNFDFELSYFSDSKNKSYQEAYKKTNTIWKFIWNWNITFDFLQYKNFNTTIYSLRQQIVDENQPTKRKLKILNKFTHISLQQSNPIIYKIINNFEQWNIKDLFHWKYNILNLKLTEMWQIHLSPYFFDLTFFWWEIKNLKLLKWQEMYYRTFNDLINNFYLLQILINPHIYINQTVKNIWTVLNYKNEYYILNQKRQKICWFWFEKVLSQKIVFIIKFLSQFEELDYKTQKYYIEHNLLFFMWIQSIIDAYFWRIKVQLSTSEWNRVFANNLICLKEYFNWKYLKILKKLKFYSNDKNINCYMKWELKKNFNNQYKLYKNYIQSIYWRHWM